MEDIKTLMSLYQLACKKILNSQGELKDYTVLNDYDNFRELFSSDDFNMIITEKHKRQAKRCRTKSKIFEMIKYVVKMKNENINLVFGTLTLNDKYIQRQDETKAKLIDGWIKKHFIRALVNKDFGDSTEREHYHFIGILEEPIEYTEFKSKKGFPLFKLANQDYKWGHEPTIEIINLEDIKKLRDYLIKLNNHSNKITTKNRLRDIKTPKWLMYELLNPEITAKKDKKRLKKLKQEKLKIATYVPLNKNSGTIVDTKIELTDEEIMELFS